ncbi:MAG: choline monooxygenase, partial [Gammaproteobacteria bacterium]
YTNLRANNRDRMLEIFEEDRDMVEGMQRGRKSPAFNGGALSPSMDQPAHCFNRIVAKAVVDALELNNGA